MSDLNGGPKEVNTLDDVAQAAVSHGLTQWQKMVQERDGFRQEADRLRQEVAHYKIAVEAQSSQLAAMESRVTEMSLVRDEAVRQAAEVRTVLHNIMAIGQPYLHSQLPVTPAEKEPEDDWEARQEAQAITREHNRSAPSPRPL